MLKKRRLSPVVPAIERFSVKTKVTLIATLFFLLSLLLVSAIQLYYGKAGMKSVLAEQQHTFVAQVADELDQKLLVHLNFVEAGTRTIPPEIIEDVGRLQKWADERHGMRAMFSDILVVSAKGVVLADTPPKGRHGLDVSDQDYFRTTVETRKPYISKPYIGRIIKQPVVIFSAPVLDQRGDVVLVLTGSLNLLQPNFLGNVAEAKIGKTGSFAVLTRDRTIVISPDKGHILTQGPAPGVSPYFDRATSGLEGSEEGVNSRGRRAIFSYTQLKVAPWVLVASLPTEEAYAPIVATQRQIVGITLLLGLLVALLVWLAVRRYYDPLEQRVRARTAELETANQNRHGEIIERKQAEEALRASETRYRRLFEAAKDGILIVDAETGIIVDVNPFLIELLGYSHEVFLQKKLWELGFFHDIVANQANFAELQEKEYVRYENKALETVDGRRIEVEFISNVYLVNDHKVIQCNIRDVSERKRTEALLQLQAAALNAAANAIVITDRDGTIRWVNRAFCALTGYSEEEAIGRNPRLLSSGKQDAEFYRRMYESILAGSVWRGEMVNRYKDGRLGTEDMTITPLRGDDGTITHFIAIKVDISERKRALEERQRQQAFLRQVIDLDHNFIFAKDRDGRFTLANQAVADAYGVTTEGLIGKTDSDFNPNREEVERFLRDDYQVMDSLTEKFIPEEKITDASGRLRWLQTVKRLILGPDGHADMVLGVATDITERKRAEREIRDLNASLERRVTERTQQLEEANRAKSDFLANMSHELRTPLNSIIGFSEMLKDGVLGELDEKQRGFITDIFDAGTHLLSLINDILDLSKVEAGTLQLEAGAVDVAALLKASTLVVREKAAAHRIRLDTRLDPALGTIVADERKVKQIVYNLLSNAVKFSPDGSSVTLSARCCTRAEVAFDEAMPARLVALPPGEDVEFLAITVEDTGVGIAKQDLQKLFEPFTQVDSSVARRHAGTGLGLSLVRRLAELHGGTVGVASRPGAGSRFCVWLPYREAAAVRTED